MTTWSLAFLRPRLLAWLISGWHRLSCFFSGLADPGFVAASLVVFWDDEILIHIQSPWADA